MIWLSTESHQYKLGGTLIGVGLALTESARTELAAMTCVAIKKAHPTDFMVRNSEDKRKNSLSLKWSSKLSARYIVLAGAEFSPRSQSSESCMRACSFGIVLRQGAALWARKQCDFQALDVIIGGLVPSYDKAHTAE